MEDNVYYRCTEIDDVIGELSGQVCGATVGHKFVAQLCQIDVFVDVSFQPGLGVLDQGWCVGYEVVYLSGESCTNCSGEACCSDKDQQIHDPYAAPSSNPRSLESINSWFDCEA